MLPTFIQHPGIEIAAAADPQAVARAAFTSAFQRPVYASVEKLAADPAVEAIYIATPHQHHAAHVAIAAAAGKHILVEKPMAITLAECDAMIASVRTAGVQLIVGHSHAFDAPYRALRHLIARGDYGRLRMLTLMTCTDFLYRPRRPEELDTAAGGGVIFSQAAHQIDIVRLLAGGEAQSVRATTGAWDLARPTEGAYQALITFAGGISASLTYSGYGRFDTDALMDWVGELGQSRDPAEYGKAWRALQEVPASEAETALKQQRSLGALTQALGVSTNPAHHNHFGFLLAHCEHADLRPTSTSIDVFGPRSRQQIALPPPVVSRSEVADDLVSAIRHGKPSVHSGAWGRATLEVCLAILESARTGRDVALHHQIAVRDEA